MRTTVTNIVDIPSPFKLNGGHYAKISGSDGLWLKIKRLRGGAVELNIVTICNEELCDIEQETATEFNSELYEAMSIINRDIEFDI